MAAAGGVGENGALAFAIKAPVLSPETAERGRAMAKISSIISVRMGKYDKPSMTKTFLMSRFGWVPGRGDREVVFVGDSPNDDPMFTRFPLTCTVANIRRYKGLIKGRPVFASSREYEEGFAEIVETVLSNR
jgi:3-deoxy-D-manno-octulosonate 8-phosphate phosphatase KdsC-like HAD superfamily phosphatase